MQSLLDKIIKYILYLIVFLTPLFFLPLTVLPVAQNKQILLAFLSFLCLTLWLIKIISSGKLTFVWSKLAGTIFFLLLILGICTAFSQARAQSFWGINLEPDTYFNFLLYGLVFFLFANLLLLPKERQLSKKDIKKPATFSLAFLKFWRRAGPPAIGLSRRLWRAGQPLTTSNILVAFLASSGVLSLFFLIQLLFKKPVFPWSFAQSLAFNPIGTAQALGLFLGGAFIILLSLMSANKEPIAAVKTRPKKVSPNQFLSAIIDSCLLSKWFGKGLAVILGILLFISILLINYWLVWLGIALSVIIIMAEMAKSISAPLEQGGFKRFILPLSILAFALIFIIIKVPTQNIVNLPQEISPTHKATFDIAFKTLKESPKNWLLGSGPASFGYKYSLYRTAGPNLTDFWQIRFNQGIAALPTFLANFGLLGVLAIFLIMAIFFWQGFKSIYRSLTPITWPQLATFSAGFYFFILWFFYPLNFSLGFALFLMLGLWSAVSINSQANQQKPREILVAKSMIKEFSFTQSPQKAFFIMLFCVVLMVAGAIGFYNISQKYRAALIYAQGLSLINRQEPKLDEGIIKIHQASTIDKKDDYFRNLSQALLLKINEILNNQELPQEQKQAVFKEVVSNAELAATTATRINPQNSQNWLQLGNIYENFFLLGIEKAEDLAISSYQRTAELDPQNPQVPLNMGRIYKSIAELTYVQLRILEQAEKKDEAAINQAREQANKNFELALGHFQKSALLKFNFVPAYYLMAQVYETQEKKAQALKNYQIVLELEPGNKEVRKKVEELSKGKIENEK